MNKVSFYINEKKVELPITIKRKRIQRKYFQKKTMGQKE